MERAFIQITPKALRSLKVSICFFFLVCTSSVFSQQYIPIWPTGEMPNSKGMQLERIEERERVTQIDVPGIYAFFTSKEENKKTAVVILPSGGYPNFGFASGKHDH